MSSARDQSDRLARLLRREHAALGDFLVALADFDRARAWEALGHTSLFYYLHRELGLSKGAAYHRKVAAGLVQRFPEVVEPLRDGRLCITSVVELSKVITPENRAEVLPRFFHCSKQEAKAVAVEIRPAAAVARRDVVTAVRAAPSVGPASPPAVSLTLVHPDEPGPAYPARGVGSQVPSPPSGSCRSAAPEIARNEVEPLTAELRRLHVTVSRRVIEKLEAARDGLSHAVPGATDEQVLEAALDALLARQAARRGLVKRPRTSVAAAEQRPSDGTGAEAARGRVHVPAPVKREVWKRDGGCCQWPMESGGICGATRFLELDHVVPVARGGPTTAANLRLLCHGHNQLAARRTLGDSIMDRFARGRARRPPASIPLDGS